MFRAFLLEEQLRSLYALEDRALAPAHLDAWLAWASRSRLQPVRSTMFRQGRRRAMHA